MTVEETQDLAPTMFPFPNRVYSTFLHLFMYSCTLCALGHQYILLTLPPPDDRDRRPHHPHDLSPSSSNEHRSPGGIAPDADRQDETGDIGLESMRTRKTATRIACTVLPVPYIRIDTEDIREALSGL